MDLKHILLIAAIIYCCAAEKKAKTQDPEKAKLLALQRQKLQYHKQKVLAPYNEGKGVTCEAVDPNKANTCIFVGSYCGFYCECPKCQCIEKDHVGVEINGIRECMPGNLDPPFDSFNASIAQPDPPASQTCTVSAQCKSNTMCAPVGENYNQYCVCPRHMVWNKTLELCQPPDREGEICDPTIGCGFGRTSVVSVPQTYIGHFCRQEGTDLYTCAECNVTNCRECSQEKQCSKCDHGYRLQKGTGTPTVADHDVCVECAAAYCKRCDSQTTVDTTAATVPAPTHATCDECLDGYFKDSTNKYTCTKKVDYQRPCKGESSECLTEGAECRSVNGNKMCTCKAGYTWNPSGCFCVHPDADLNVEVNRTCKYDRKNFKMDDDYFQNDGSLKVCKAGLECVDSCSPCAGCPGQTVCVTPIPYPEPPCKDRVTLSSGGNGGGGSTNASPNTPSGGTAGGAGAGAGSGTDSGKSAAVHTGTSVTAVFASLAVASLFW